ncbi:MULTISPECIES: hypothetical protein [Marisediminitalea]|jgi:hypothetical protein|uniref:hypothetical protein n=1 Tax=Marisediminitalea TaxID=2662254 RepID=UPI0020CC2A16|nr:hypothetical protein [Marisediminitalea aggregata]MCP3863427.1 hypothetical protein [Aestuariibacter sp.]MCP4232301.1 hypothetical protein [Aestuariibacter sp.]MCP4526025.1 hypothetical protein [Aestuariibacter sp.]MCP4946578.1 hypothetical protein [Aestuariibacter sp.]MCP5009516.1 hypothetical protein [Aestuariibacter sp.]|tara:strand:+ start:105 stop:362 length:258 start_codon:yes stop_codon:yes gene_type:complete
MSVLALAFTFSGCLLIYVTNKNQRLFANQKSLTLRYLGYLLSCVALMCWLNAVSVSAAILIWLLSIMVILALIPILSLVRPGRQT